MSDLSFPQSILDLENRSLGVGGEPTLAAALELAAEEWRSGNRDRELGLHLLFLSWYCNIEPSHLTGYEKANGDPNYLPNLFQEVYRSFAGDILNDVECLFVVGLMARLSSWLLGEDPETWDARSVEFRKRYRQLAPKGLSATVFANRGAYGDYFGRQAVVPGGF